MASGNLVLVLGDQLSQHITSLVESNKENDVVLMAEVQDEATYVRHHKKKIAFLFSAMRHFAEDLRAAGWSVDYIKLDDDDNSESLFGEVKRALDRHKLSGVRLTEPGEWRLADEMRSWSEKLSTPVELLSDRRFITSKSEFLEWADGRKQLRMETFYREVRKKTGLLMDGENPVGGQWNFDAENRKRAEADLFMPAVAKFKPDAITQDVIALVAERFSDHFGDLEPFWFAVTAQDAASACDHFIDTCLVIFGEYQDAMLTGERFLYHSVLSHYINCGLLDPMEVCRKAQQAFIDDKAPINAVEGFIRQIIGWREYVRGIYWLKMPEYGSQNFFDAQRALPEFYWSAETDMRCVSEVVTQTKEEAYAHHIQRLMVTGNFAMLAGVNPQDVHEWYLAVYADAYEWVELPNVIGMSQFADGGQLGSKPYAASGNYINKMSNYCDTCQFDVKKKTGDGACPFNALYWDFLARNQSKLENNPRLRNAFATWRRMSEDKQQDYRASAAKFLESLG